MIIRQLFDLEFSLFPLRDQSKEPALAWGRFQHERCTAAELNGWLQAGRQNFGIACGRVSGIVVIDTDNDATETWAGTNLPGTSLMVRTARGLHRYYRWLPELPAFFHPAGLTIEIKRDGHFVVAPGSLHPSGSIYELVGTLPGSVLDLPIFPTNVLDPGSSAGTTATSSEPFDFPDVVQAGERHATLFKALRSLKALGVDKASVREMVHVANQERCQPPVKEDHIFDAWFERAWANPDKPMPGRVPLDVDLDQKVWL